MKPQFQHEIVTSFALWLENHILRKGQAYQNKKDQKFFYQEDDRLDSNYVSFASPHKQWVTDSSINGANIIDSVDVDGLTVNRNTSGVYFDFDNGRVLIPKEGGLIDVDQNSSVKGDYAVKDFNIYITDQTEEELLLEAQFDTNSRFHQEVTEGIKPYDHVLPAIFISYESSKNEPFAFGGQDTTRTNIRCVVFSENSYQLDGVLSLLNDANDLNLTNVGFSEHPLNEFGDLKNGSYNYEDLISRYFQYRSIAIVDSVNVSKLNDRVAKKTHPGLFLGFADFELISVRMPRSDHETPVAAKDPAAGAIPLAPFNLKLEPDCSSQYSYSVDVTFMHNNTEPYSADLYVVYKQSGLVATGFGDWNPAVSVVPSGKSSTEFMRATSIDFISGADYNFKVSALNANGEVFGINPVYSGMNFLNCS